MADLPQRLAALVDDIQVRTQDNGPAGALRTEIDLAPASLGRIQVTLETGERGLHLAVTAERPESLDVIRRQIETLHRALVQDGIPIDRVELGSSPRSASADATPAQSQLNGDGPGGQKSAAGSSADGRQAASDRDDPSDTPNGRADTTRDPTDQAPSRGRLDLRL